MRSSLPFKHLVILVNPDSTHARSAEGRIARLEQALPETQVRVLKLHKGVTAQTLLAKHESLLGKNTLFGIAGGDGTVNAVIKFLLKDSTVKETRYTVILPLWGGNANDLAHMLNGPAYLKTIDEAITYGQIVPIHPLCCELTEQDGTQKQYVASGYISFGATALAARRLNTLLHRNSAWHKWPGGRFMRECLTVIETWLKVSAFHIEENGVSRAVYERIFINGSRMAKIRPLPLKLTDKGFYAITIQQKQLSAFVMYARELFRRPIAEQTEEEANFLCNDQAWGQFDGETFQIKPATRVRIYRLKKPFQALSTRLEPKSANAPGIDSLHR